MYMYKGTVKDIEKRGRKREGGGGRELDRLREREREREWTVSYIKSYAVFFLIANLL